MTPRTIPEALKQQVEKHPDKRFVKCGGEWLTFADADGITDALAGGFSQLGVSRLDRVGTVLPNSQALIEIFIAMAKLGSVVVPFNAYLKGEFLRYQALDSGVRVVVVDSAGYKSLRPFLSDTTIERLIFTDGGKPEDCPVETTDFASLKLLVHPGTEWV